ncbi:hypothetical protein BGX26_004945, partial [Mortierella sp. AD094]
SPPILECLRVIAIRRAIIDNGHLERLVDACPNLRELRIIGVRVVGVQSTPVFNKPGFFRHLSATCPQLKRLHFSVLGQPYTESDIESAFYKDLPNLNEWSISETEFHTSLSYAMEKWMQKCESNIRGQLTKQQSVYDPKSTSTPQVNPTTYGNHLTWLELTRHPQFATEFTVKSLHLFLCHSPNLEHLLAPGYSIEVRNLDINMMIESPILKMIRFHGILSWERPITPKSFSSSYPCKLVSGTIRSTGEYSCNQIWACRRLKTLHLRFKEDNSTDVSRTGVLVVFGYLGRVCPNIQDLHISVRRTDMELNAGLCLLTRMRKLERFQLDCTIRKSFGVEDLAWIRRHPESAATIVQRLYQVLG